MSDYYVHPLAVIQAAAMVCHEANRAYCATLGDHSQPPWHDAPDWMRNSAMQGVVRVWENPSSNPRETHESWLAEKVADGWTYGKVKDPVQKTHPCVMPYDSLPEDQQRKDYLFLAVARALRP